MGVRLTVIDPADVEALEKILKTEGATLFFSEQITNPLTRIIDTVKIAALCKEYKTICCIDTTFATPVNHKPIDLGADIVLHSGTAPLLHITRNWRFLGIAPSIHGLVCARPYADVGAWA